MNDYEMTSDSHAVYSLRLHIVFVTKYRRKTCTPEILAALRDTFAEILAACAIGLPIISQNFTGNHILTPNLLRRECRRSIQRDGKMLCRGSRDERKTSEGSQEAATRLTPPLGYRL